MDINLVRVPQDVDVVNVRWNLKPAKWGERPAFFSVHVDSYATVSCFCVVYHRKLIWNSTWHKLLAEFGPNGEFPIMHQIYIYIDAGLHYDIFSRWDWDSTFKQHNRHFPLTFAIWRKRQKLRYWVGFFYVLSLPLKTAFGTIGNCRLRLH